MRITKKVAAAGIAGMLGVTGIAVLTAPVASATTTTEEGTTLGGRLQAVTEALAGLVTDGTLTQEQADEVATTLDASDVLNRWLDGGSIADARVAITALAPTIRRVPDAEAALTGSDGAADAIAAAARAVAAGSSPITDVRGSAGYRSAMAEVIAGRAISAALVRARGEDVPIPASAATFAAPRGTS